MSRTPPPVSALTSVKRLLAEAAGVTPTSLEARGAVDDQLDQLARLFALSAFERDVIALAALPALEPDGGAFVAAAQGDGADASLRIPTVALALSVLPDGHWSAFAPEGRLLGADLVELSEQPLASARGLILHGRVLHHLVGLDGLDQELATSSLRLAPLPGSGQAPSAVRRLTDYLSAASDGPDSPIIHLRGSDRRASAALAAAVAEQLGRRAYLIEPDLSPLSNSDRAKLARLWSRETALSDVIPVIDAHDAADPAETRAVARFAAAIRGPVVVLAAEDLGGSHRPWHRLDTPRPTLDEQTLEWEAALGPTAERLRPTIERVTSHFTAPPDAIRAVAALARGAAGDGADARSDGELEALLWTETRKQTRPRLDELAQRIEARAGWDDIVLPPSHGETLRAIASQVRHRRRVYETWGFGGGARRGLGITALFSGPSGVGKTLAAEVIAGALDLDLYRIDLSAVVSKWIGETEKNLRRVFDAAEDTSAILLFDEADALFGKRADVKDSHDRYANIEVSYLLQRMENYRGLAILTSNLRASLDQAFLRRLRFVVEFPFPGEAERRAIWRLSIPPTAPCVGLDFERLAQLTVTGGSIRNIALNAAFMAAEADAPISLTHIQRAARAEYEKLGKPLTAGEMRGWPAAAASG